MDITGDQKAGEAIVARRSAFNHALAIHDIAGIKDFLTPRVLLITGDDNALIEGSEAQMEAWRGIFSAQTDGVYVRTPSQIQVADTLPTASEIGDWVGTWTAFGLPHRAQGQYHAKWRRQGKIWRLEAESFITLAHG